MEDKEEGEEEERRFDREAYTVALDAELEHDKDTK
jgi:hypothetical protein